MSEPVRVGIVGLGTVGSGVVRLLVESADHITRHAGRPIVVERAVCRDVGRDRGLRLAADRISTDIGTIYLPLEGIIDPATEAKRLDGEIRKVEAEIDKVAKKLSSETFVQNAPAEVVADHRQRQQDWLAKLSELQKAITALG